MEQWKQLFRAEIHDRVIGGVALAIGGAEADLLEYCDGFAAPGGAAMTPDTIIDIASMTKVVATTTALLICRDRNLIDFDAPFVAYLPDFEAKLLEPITVRELAMHISGFSHAGTGARQYDAPGGPEIMRNILLFPPLFPPRQRFEYTCWNFLLLGLIVERITGRTLTEFCRREIFEPLQMHDTSLGQPVCDDPDRLAQTCDTPRAGTISDFIAGRVYRDGGAAGNAGAFSTVRDLAKFCRAMLNGGGYGDGKRLFSEASFHEMVTNRMPAGMPERSFGWVMKDEVKPAAASERMIYHSGWSGQTIFIDFGRRRFVIILTTRYGDYERAKRERAEAASLLLEQFKTGNSK